MIRAFFQGGFGPSIKAMIGYNFLLLPCDQVTLLIAIGYVFLFVSIVS